MNTMTKKAATLSVEGLKTEISKMMDCFSDEAAMVLNALLGALESKISADEFVEFCNAI